MFQRRLVLFCFFSAVAVCILVARLAWLQLYRGAEYVEMSQKLLERQGRWLDTVRGAVYDCRGEALAIDQPDFQVCLHYKLTRLYYRRFWRDQELRYLARKENLDKTRQDAARYTHLKYGPQRRKTDELLIDLADICDVSMDDLHESIKKLNERIFILRTSRARRKWYAEHKEPYQPEPNAAAIQEDFARRVPDDDQRLMLIYKTNVMEMEQAQPILSSVSPDTALAVRIRFVGDFLAGVRNRPITIRNGKKRLYFHQDTMQRLVGQLGVVPPDFTRNRPQEPNQPDLAEYYIGDRRGAWGVEYMFESLLRGRRGWLQQDIEGDTIVEIDRIIGSDVRLTIDVQLQKRILELFRGQNDQRENYNGAAVVIDVATGQIRALVSAQPKGNWINSALGKNYQPGSTIKPILLLGALENGIVRADTQIDCSTHNIDWHSGPMDIHNHGLTKAAKAIKVSCNFYFVKIADKWGPRNMADWLGKCGFGRTVTGWPDGPSGGRAETFCETAGHTARQGRTYPSPVGLRFISIGRGALDGSVLQMANSVAIIARDGEYLAPTLVSTRAATRYAQRLSSIKNVRLVQQAMRKVIYETGGTGYNAFHPLPWDEKEVQLYGKTGSTTDKSLFVCYAGGKDGRCLAVAVVVEVAEAGSAVAAPLARDILRVCSQEGYLPATTTETD